MSRADLFSGQDAFGKTWQIQQIEIDLGTLLPNSCVTDNFITYYPNGTYEINEGATKCDPSDLPGIIGEWYLDSMEERLFVEIDDSIQVWDIDETQTDSHKITSSFKEGNRTYTFTLSN
ncbi:hypothetical protein [Ekhidna sp.]|uniref:hypothetical protein n=1 Tax=Ekhidna sp. TaxID=2608089 RepID=UPI00329884D6